ncbi:MAG: efflux RND transporter periplasmic adaptor subunit [Solitalea sp.]
MNSIFSALPGYALAVVAFLCVSCTAKETKQEADTYIATRPVRYSADLQREYIADIRPLQHIAILSKISGFLEGVHVEEGSFVRKGQLLFTLRENEYRDELSKSQAALEAARAQLREIDVEMENVKLLVEKNVVSKAELAALQTKRNAAQAAIREAESDIAISKKKLSYTRIHAPFSGFVDRIPGKPGALISEGDRLTTLSDNSEMLVYYTLSEIDYLRQASDTVQNPQVRLRLADGSLFPHPGIRDAMAGEMDAGTGTISFRARFPNPENLLRNGLSGKVIVNTPLHEALIIPIASTFAIQENLYVYVVDDRGVIVQRKVEPLARLDKGYAIAEGLSEQDLILFEGLQFVREGQQVQVIETPMDELLVGQIQEGL